MKPATARVVITVTCLSFVIAGVCVVNSSFGGSFLAGLLIIVLPLLGLSYLFPHILPVRCQTCRVRMSFHFVARGSRLPAAGAGKASELYGYVCESCQAQHLWEGVSSGSHLD